MKLDYRYDEKNGMYEVYNVENEKELYAVLEVERLARMYVKGFKYGYEYVEKSLNNFFRSCRQQNNKFEEEHDTLGCIVACCNIEECPRCK